MLVVGGHLESWQRFFFFGHSDRGVETQSGVTSGQDGEKQLVTLG